MKRYFALFILLLSALSGTACTTFLLSHGGQHYFGRNYDWVTGNGLALINPRGVQKTATPIKGQELFQWESLYGSLTFNQYGREFPTGGMNEAGLVVELMWLDETGYPPADARPALSELQWIQYQLDRSKNVEEVVRSIGEIRIAPNSVPLHFLVADAGGRAATIEFIGGKPVIHQGTDLPFPVLTNTTYAGSLPAVKGGAEGTSSAGRFATACRLLQSYRASDSVDPVSYSFSILDKVEQGAFTKWKIVYDISGREVHFLLHGEKRKTISFASLSFECSEGAQQLPLQGGEGDRSQQFRAFTAADNRSLLEKSALESRPNVHISKEEIERALAAAAASRCR